MTAHRRAIPDDIFEKATTRRGWWKKLRKRSHDQGQRGGGGGKGIRLVENEKDLRNASMQVQSEVTGRGSYIFVMRLCQNARHLEVLSSATKTAMPRRSKAAIDRPGIIREQSVMIVLPHHLVVVTSTAMHKAFQHAR